MEQTIIRPSSTIRLQQQLPLWLAVMAAYVWLVWPSLASMAEIWWRSDTYAHGMVVPVISAWLIYRRRQLFRNIATCPCWWALPLVVASATGWLLGRAADLLAIEQLAAATLWLALVLMLLGWPLVRQLLFPLGYLLFAVPLGEELTPWLQQVTADITVMSLQLSGIPVYVNGLFIEIPSGRFEVAQACSGIRYLIASLAVGTLYGYLTFNGLRKRLIFAGAALLVPILANGIRAYLIVLIAHLSDMKYATGADHLIYGWLFFGLVMLLLFWVGNFWRDDEPSRATVQTEQDAGRAQSANRIRVAAVAAFALLTLTAFGDQRQRQTPASTPAVPYQLNFSDWSAAVPAPYWNPAFKAPDRSFSASYENAAKQQVDLYLADYLSEAQDKELINSQNRPFPEPWVPAGNGVTRIDAPAVKFSVAVTEVRHPNGAKRLVWYFYQVGDQLLHQGIRVKLTQAWQRLSGTEPVSRVILLSTPYEERPAAEQRLRRFLVENWPQLAASALSNK